MTLKITRCKTYEGKGRPPLPAQIFVHYQSEDIPADMVVKVEGARITLQFHDVSRPDHLWEVEMTHGFMDEVLHLWADPDEELRERLKKEEELRRIEEQLKARDKIKDEILKEATLQRKAREAAAADRLNRLDEERRQRRASGDED